MFRKINVLLIITVLLPIFLYSQPVKYEHRVSGSGHSFYLSNNLVTLAVAFQEGTLIADSLKGSATLFTEKPKVVPPPAPAAPYTLASDAGFALDVVWTDWQAPGKKNNGDNPVRLTGADFSLKDFSVKTLPEDGCSWQFVMKGKNTPLQVILTYELEPRHFFYRRSIAVCDSAQEVHFLQTLHSRIARFSLSRPGKDVTATRWELLNPGGFGQPLAYGCDEAGAFLALEYPAAHNEGSQQKNMLTADLTREVGKIIGRTPLVCDPEVCALVPGNQVQSWFFDYLDDVRVAPAEPYTLYNSWYDLRSPEYPGVKPENVMNEENVFHIIDLFQKNMTDRHHIQMDAFVLDDGWDVYESDWVMRQETFPRGLKPLSDRLKSMGTRLGIWFGPTGGYSFRMKRIDWMKAHGYEVVGKGRDYAMMCLGGSRYKALFEKRVTDMVSRQGVSYFKWDGIQFSCSEPDHGHPTGIYSRDAILESLVQQCKAVRKINPSTYLNITSGTWLSPWWLKYANQIWMDGGDYGFAEVPSIHQRDAAITYRDFVLYDDFKIKGLWFPTSNLMTHGIIKGNLENVGGEHDPIDKFTNDVVLYFARGISMYELYISPDLLKDEEWEAIGKAIQWAKDNREVLAKTFMAGGNPTKGETYGYVHFKGNRGIVAARNPVVKASTLTLKLDPQYGLNKDAGPLVVEKIYPYHYIYPSLFSPGDDLEISLDGFETVILQVYPSVNAGLLPAGIRFTLVPQGEKTCMLQVFDPNPHAIFLGQAQPAGMSANGQAIGSLRDLPMPRKAAPVRIVSPAGNQNVDVLKPIEISIGENVREGTLSFLVQPSAECQGMKIPEFKVMLDGKNIQAFNETENGKWIWISVIVGPGTHSIQLIPVKDTKAPLWTGSAEVWAMVKITENPVSVVLTFASPLPEKTGTEPPLPYPSDLSSQNFPLTSGELTIDNK